MLNVTKSLRTAPLAALDARPGQIAALVIAALTLWRVLGLALAKTDLYSDESLYWFWSTEPALGYFSKPPLIAWVIRLSTAIGGSDSAFWVRLPAPLFLAAAAAVVGGLGSHVFGRRIGALSAILLALMPGVSVGSIVAATDALLLPFYALGVLAWVRLLERPHDGWAATLGLAIGCGLYAKYAALYLPLCMALAALVSPRLRLTWRSSAIAFGIWLIVAGPHLWWSIANGFVTVSHVAGDAEADVGRADLKDMMEFLLAQFGVFGPLTLVVWLQAMARPALLGGDRTSIAALGWASLPIVLVIAFQALRGGAEPNWAVQAYAAATPLAAAALARAPRLLVATLVLHGALALGIAMLPSQPDLIHAPNGRSVLARMMGRQDLAARFAAIAKAQQVDTIIVENRGLTSDLLYYERGSGLKIYAPRPGRRTTNDFYSLLPLPPHLGRPAILVTQRETPGPLPGLEAVPVAPLETIQPQTGFFARKTLRVWRLEPTD